MPSEPGTAAPLHDPALDQDAIVPAAAQLFAVVTGSLIYKLGLAQPPPSAGLGSMTTLRPDSRFVPTIPGTMFAGFEGSATSSTMIGTLFATTLPPSAVMLNWSML